MGRGLRSPWAAWGERSWWTSVGGGCCWVRFRRRFDRFFTDSCLEKSSLCICRRIFMENESIWFDDRHSDCVRTRQAGWKRGHGNQGVGSRLIFWSQGSCITMCRAWLKSQSHRVVTITSWVPYSVYCNPCFNAQHSGNRNQIYVANLPSNTGLGASYTNLFPESISDFT